MASRHATHWNDHMMAAISIKCSGPQPFHHDILQVCILPLDSDCKPLKEKGLLPFYLEMVPKRPENVDYKELQISKDNYFKIIQSAMDADRTADLFDEWFEKLQLAPNKKLMPLTHDWAITYAFMLDWLGFNHMEHYFSNQVRDLLTGALIENDRADVMVSQTPYPKLGLKYICSCLKVEHDRGHDALQDCLAASRAYRQLLRQTSIQPGM